jgi:hypothetical protein
MQIDSLNLSHRDLIEDKFHKLNLSLSEYSFANLYLFRELYHYQLLTCDEEVFIKGITRDNVSFIMLTSHPENLSFELLKSIVSEAQILFPISESWLISLEKHTLQASFKKEDSDYLFATPKLAHFPGRHLSKKRNLVKQLLETHEIKAENFNNQLDDALKILESWQQAHADLPLETDYKACQEAIYHFQNLHLHGRIIYVDQLPAGFAIGEWISKDCYVVHFCKASRTIKGLYQYLYQDIAQSVEGTHPWINLEQDLGLTALRDSKKSYLPDQFLRKWRVLLNFP